MVRLRHWLRTREARRLLAMLGVALLLRLALAPWFSFFGDSPAYIYWGSSLHAHFFDLYSALSSNPNLRFSPQYPPLAMYVFGGCVALYHALAAVFGLPAATYLHPSQALLAVMKLPAIACDLGVSALIYWLARQRLAAKWALIAAASYAFAPAVVVDGAMWGQTDGVTMLPLLLALVCAQRRRGGWAGIALALAALFKPTALLFAPLLLVYLWRWAGPKEVARGVGAAVATGVIVCLPYLMPPHFDLLTYPHVLATSLSYYPVASPSAFNLWFALLIPGHPARAPYLGPLSPAVIGYALFAGFLALALVHIWRSPSPARFYCCAGFVALASFDVTALQLERYLFPAIGLFLLAALYDRRAVKLYVLVSAACFINMWARVIVFNSLLIHAGWPLNSLDWALAARPWYGSLALLMSLVDVAALLVLTRRLIVDLAPRPPHLQGEGEVETRAVELAAQS